MYAENAGKSGSVKLNGAQDVTGTGERRSPGFGDIGKKSVGFMLSQQDQEKKYEYTRIPGGGAQLITIYEYTQTTQAWVVDKLKQAGLMAADYAVPRKQQEPEITFAEAVELMKHDSYRRIKRVIRQVGTGVVIR